MLALQRTAGNGAVAQLLTRPSLQRWLVVSDQNGDPEQDYLGEIDRHVRGLDEPWLNHLIASSRLVLTINAEPRFVGTQAPYEGRTAVTRVNGQLISQTRTVGQWHQLLAGADQVMIAMNVLPRVDQAIGDVLAVVMHELYLHVRPISQSLDALAGSQFGPATTGHVANAMNGEEAQHSDPAAWAHYLRRARDIGADWIGSGRPSLIKKGVDLILSAVNDLMTHLNPELVGTPQDKVPTMPGATREQLFDEANQVGAEMVQIQEGRPDIWPDDSDSDSDSGPD